MKILTSNAVSIIVNFVNERSVEKSIIGHRRTKNDDVVIDIRTSLQPRYYSPKGNKVSSNGGYKYTCATFDAETGEILSFESYINVGFGPEDIEFNGPFDLMPSYHKRVTTETVLPW